MAENISPIIGIDLGTSNSAVTWFSQGQPQLINGAQGERLTPSVVGLDDMGNVLIGEPAKARLVSHPHLVIPFGAILRPGGICNREVIPAGNKRLNLMSYRGGRRQP